MKTGGKTILIGAVAVFAVVFALASLTVRDMGMSWDEGIDIDAARGAETWFGALADNPAAAFSRDSIERHWGYEWKQHPAVTRIYYTITHPLFNRFSQDPAFTGWISYRYCSAALFAALAALVFAFGAARFGVAAGAVAAVSLAGMPRVFGHARIVETDMMLCAFYFAAAAAFLKGLGSKRWAVVFGVLLGLLPAVKFNGIFAAAPLFAYGLVFERGKLRWNLLAALLVAPAAFFLVQPMYWNAPIKALSDYVGHFLNPEARATIVTYYFGGFYPSSPPFSYPFIISLLTVPAAILAAAAAGAASGLFDRQKRPAIIFLVINAVFFLILFAPRRVAVYDGERLFLAVFPFWALLAGAGAEFVLRRYPASVRAASVIVFAVWCAFNLAQTRPFHLTYYNELIGGTAGAERRGLEVIYWGEAFTPGFAALIDNTLPRDSRIAVVGYYSNNLVRYQRLGLLRGDLRVVSYGEEADFLLVFNRRGVMDERTRQIYDRAPPLIAVGARGVRLAAVFLLKPGVDLLRDSR